MKINGTDYSSWDEVPADLRAELEEQGLDWDSLIAAMAEAARTGKSSVLGTTVRRTTTTTYRIGDHEYHSLEEMPPELREAFEKARAAGAARTPGALGEGQVELNGEVVDAAAPPRRRHWWQRR